MNTDLKYIQYSTTKLYPYLPPQYQYIIQKLHISNSVGEFYDIVDTNLIAVQRKLNTLFKLNYGIITTKKFKVLNNINLAQKLVYTSLDAIYYAITKGRVDTNYTRIVYPHIYEYIYTKQLYLLPKFEKRNPELPKIKQPTKITNSIKKSKNFNRIINNYDLCRQ